MIGNQRLRGAGMADRLGVRPQTFYRRAKRCAFPRLPDGTYDVEATVRLWNRTASGRGGWRRNAGAKPRLSKRSQLRAASEDVSIEALVEEMMAEFHDAPWPGVFPEREPGRRHSFIVAEARSALAEVPLARAWLLFAWLMGGSWVPLDDS